MTLQDSHRPLVRDSGLSTFAVGPLGLAEPLGKDPDFYVGPLVLAEALGKDPNLHSVPCELSLAANSDNLDDALCTALIPMMERVKVG